MEIRRQTCQNCRSKNLRNLLVREPGKHEEVYVQCRQCKKLVARYTLSDMGYFHQGKGFDSFLRSVESGGHVASAQDLHETFNKISDEAEEKFEKILRLLEEKGKNDDL